MLEENKAVELRDEELKKVSGGVVGDIDICDVRFYKRGDAFIFKQDPVFGIVLRENTTTSGNTNDKTDVSCIQISNLDGRRWDQQYAISYVVAGQLEDTYEYSAEITAELKGKINYL